MGTHSANVGPSVRAATPADLPRLARCHREAFPSSLSSAMGTAYVAQMLGWYLSTDKTFLFYVSDEGGRVLGYCGGMVSDGTLPTGSASGMMQHSFAAAVRAMLLRPWLWLHPEMRKRYGFAWGNLKMRLRRKKQAAKPVKQAFAAPLPPPSPRKPTVGLVVIGVSPAAQGKGYGSVLLREFERRAAAYCIPTLQLSVLAHNAQAIRAYERNGWVAAERSGESLQMYKEIAV